ncbi:hypothetical protein HDU86_003470 [Geranomyces michiganensis]|nr:hypothetical protein HDU86_003470 [Geranomyces michiganensis]
MGGNKEKRVDQKKTAQKEKEQKVAGEREARESEKWTKGAKVDKKAEEEQKKLEAAQKKKEREELLAAEERALAASAAKPSQVLKGSAKKAESKSAKHDAYTRDSGAAIPEFAASGLDDALSLLDVAVAAPSGGGTGGLKGNDKMERHPEKRMKSAWAAFEEREMPILKAEQPGLRLSQYKQALAKKWKKSPENPMNQESVAFDTSRQEEREMIAAKREEALEKHRVK